MEMPYVCLYASYLTSLAPFTDEQVGKLFRAMLAYGTAGKEPEFQDCERYIWPMLRDQLDRDLESYRQRREKNRARTTDHKADECKIVQEFKGLGVKILVLCFVVLPPKPSLPTGRQA